MKGIILAGGTGSRLYPLTIAVNKQLLPVYDKPMIYYPLATLMLAGIRDILIITRPEDQAGCRLLLGDGSHLGIALSYATQERPAGIAEALLIGRNFLNNDPCTLVLGDNIFFSHDIADLLAGISRTNTGATIFGYWVSDPERYGIVDFDRDGNVLGIEEKPARPRSNYAVTGLYFYDGEASARAALLRPSARGELEITDLNKSYLADGRLRCVRLNRGFAWLDAGTPDSLLDAASYIATIERRQALKIACIEEIAWRGGWIDDAQMGHLAATLRGTAYGTYLDRILRQSARDLSST